MCQHCGGWNSEVNDILFLSSWSSYSNLKRRLNKAVFCIKQVFLLLEESKEWWSDTDLGRLLGERLFKLRLG